jgi:hypothetical protein
VSHLRAPFGKRRPCESGEDAGKTHPRGGCTVCQRGESLGGGCVRMVGGRGVRGRQPGVVGVAVASSSRRIVNRLFSVCGATVGSPIARVEPRAAWHSPRAVQGTQDWTRVSGAFQSPGTEEISLYVGTGASVPPKSNVGRHGVQSGLAAEADLCHVQCYPPGPRDRKASTP